MAPNTTFIAVFGEEDMVSDWITRREMFEEEYGES
jgi:hypothetical protein